MLGTRNRLGIKQGPAIDLISVMWSKLTFFLSAGSKFTRFLCGGQNLRGFRVRAGIVRF